jgi:hypothetical protein
MKRIEIKNLVSILTESPFYLTIPLTERYLPMKSLVKDYPTLSKRVFGGLDEAGR